MKEQYDELYSQFRDFLNTEKYEKAYDLLFSCPELEIDSNDWMSLAGHINDEKIKELEKACGLENIPI